MNHTWFRKNENRAGRWTSPDPYNGSISIGNPQSFNRYSYVENEPTNYVDPSGLQQTSFIFCEPNRWDPSTATLYVGRCFQYLSGSGINIAAEADDFPPVIGGDLGGLIELQHRPLEFTEQDRQREKKCMDATNRAYEKEVNDAWNEYKKTDTSLTSDDWVKVNPKV